MKKYFKTYSLIITFIVCLICLFLDINISAENKLFTCNYNVIIISESKYNDAITFPLTVSVYDDKTSTFKNTKNHSLNKKNELVYFSSDEISTYYVGLKDTDFYKYSVNNNQYSCPALTLVRNNANAAYYTLYFEDLGNNFGVDYQIVTSEVKPKAENNNDNNVATETKTCTPLIYTNDELGGKDFKLKLKAYSNGEKKVCISMNNLSDTCKVVKSGEDLTITHVDGISYYYKIEAEQLSNFFIQNDSQKKENTFDCPNKVYIAYVNSSPVTYILTSSKEDAEDLSNKFSELNKDNSENSNSSNDDSDNSSKSDVTDIKNAFIGTTSCGGIKNFQFPNALPNITSFAYNLLKIAIPVILIIKGSLDMFKAVSSQKEDEMKKAQKKFTQRLIAGFLAFFVLMIVETVINFIADKTDNNNAMDCVNCFIKGSNYCTKN